MSRSPLFYPLNRALDSDAGGVADLQTDVMRFMASLSLCLVAIFALVQSIPLAPEPPPISEESSAEETIEPQERPTPPPETNLTLVRPQLPKPPPKAEPVELQRPVLQPVTRRAVPERIESKMPAPTPAPPQPAKKGFTLRFEDDTALTRLVARNDVGLYAIKRDSSYRMSINRGRMSFWPASIPNQFHEMDAATVPAAVVDAFRRGRGTATSGFTWAVTIPANMSRQLDEYLREHTGGALIIDADGALRLEP